jgi:hypothetical protein
VWGVEVDHVGGVVDSDGVDGARVPDVADRAFDHGLGALIDGLARHLPDRHRYPLLRRPRRPGTDRTNAPAPAQITIM